MAESTPKKHIRIHITVDTDKDKQKKYSFYRVFNFLVDEQSLNKTMFAIVSNLNNLKELKEIREIETHKE